MRKNIIAETLQLAKEDSFELPFKLKEYLIAAAQKNTGAHSHLCTELISRYRRQVRLANAYAFALSEWEECIKDFGEKSYPVWLEKYDPNTI